MSSGAIADAAMLYNASGIVTHPLSAPTDTKPSPGKRPLKTGWQKLTTGMSEADITKYIWKDHCNIGAVCGKASDLMVIDVDYYIKGVWEEILKGVDTSNWIKQYRTNGRWHWLFKFNSEFELKHSKPLGIDLLGEAGNVVLAPSVHKDGDVYQIAGNIADRPDIPEEVITRLKGLLKSYDMLKTSLNKCRWAFKEFFKAVFEDDKGEMYHDLSAFRGMEGRQRTLHLFAELKANGATDRELILVCMLAFGDAFDYDQTVKEIGYITPTPAKNESIRADSILSQFHREGEQYTGKTTQGQAKAGGYSDCYEIDEENSQIYINLAETAATISAMYNMMTYRDTVYAYDGRMYTEGQQMIDKTIMEVVNEAVSMGGKMTGGIKRIAADIEYMIKNSTLVFDYPFGATPDMIPCKNGIIKIDFESASCELIPHSPKYRFNYCLPVNYKNECIWSEWDNTEIHDKLICKWVKEQGDIDILYQIPAQAIIQAMGSSQPYKKAYIIQAEPHAGKSTYLEMLYKLLGVERFCHQSLQDIAVDRFAISSLENKLINAYDDLTDVPMNSTGKFKALTGAYDHDIEQKHIKKYPARITAVHVFTCNVPPGYDSRVKKDTAFWERWEYVKFVSRFPINTTLCDDVLTDDNMSAFFNTVLRYIIEIVRNKSLFIKSTASEVREKWSLAADPIYEFIDAHIDKTAGHMFVGKDDFLDSLIRWANAEGKDLDKIPNTVKALTTALDKYDIYAVQKRNDQGIHVHCYDVQCGAWNVNSPYATKIIKTKTEQMGFA
jgi:phage/plasmid-associated DNA primase